MESKWKDCMPISKGWSKDRKYKVTDESGNEFLLRISDISAVDKKRKEYEMLKVFSSLGFPSSCPLSFGTCTRGTECFMLLTWVDGEDLEKVLPSLPDSEQHRLGEEAGLILKKIHSSPVASEDIPSVSRTAKKLRQLDDYISSDNRIEDDEKAIKFIRDNAEAVCQERAAVYLHGDFHPGNLIYTPSGRIGVIDYNRWKTGDPYEEFYKLECFAAEYSVPFVKGLITSYFEGNIPERFWHSFAFYSLHAALYTIRWAEQFGKEEAEANRRRARRILSDFGDFSSFVPCWHDAVSEPSCIKNDRSGLHDDSQVSLC